MRAYKLATLASIFIAACSTTGQVDTVQGDSLQPVVAAPARFTPAAADLAAAEQQLKKFDSRLHDNDNLNGAAWRQFLDWQQAFDTAHADQSASEDELENTGELVLEPGGSYSIDLESYCVHPGTARPVKGDGLRIARLRGPAGQWIFEILKAQGTKKVDQESVQILIWALLYDARFDELNQREQATLLQFLSLIHI